MRTPMRWLCSRRLCPDAEQTLGEVYINPGARNAVHSHPNCEELLYVISGECDHSLDGRTVRLTAGSMIRVPAGARHHAENTGWEPVRMLISLIANSRKLKRLLRNSPASRATISTNSAKTNRSRSP